MHTPAIILGFLMLSLGLRPVLAQGTSGDPLAALRTSYETLQFEQAAQEAEALLQRAPTLGIDQLTEVHTLLGLMAYAQQGEQAARRQFEAALSLNPGLVLDSVLVSPKILAFFEAVKADTYAPPSGAESDAGEIRYIVVSDPRPQALMRTFIVPGWGQWYQGRRAKGGVLMGLWIGTVGGAAVAHVARSRAAEAYQTETNPALVEGRYQTFNTRHRIRNGLLIAAAGVWLFSYLDVLRAPPPTPTDAGFSFAPSGLPHRPTLRIQYHF